MWCTRFLTNRNFSTSGKQRNTGHKAARGRQLPRGDSQRSLEPLEQRLLLTTPPFLVSELGEWHADDMAVGNEFGQGVAFSNNIAVIGSPKVDQNGRNSGAAYIFQRVDNPDGDPTPADPTDDSWSQLDKLVPSDGNRNDEFGMSVAIAGDDAKGYTIAIGAPFGDGIAHDSGAVYVYTLGVSSSGATLMQKLTPSDGAKGDAFGGERALSISGDTLVVGARNHSDAGAAYVFENANGTWTQSAKLVASDSGSRDEFGRSVDISGTTIAVGARAAGGVYIFEKEGANWAEQTILRRSDGESLGWDVSLSATEDTVVASSIWRAFVFEKEGPSWTGHSGTELIRLRPWDRADSDDDFRFGWSVAVHSDAADPEKDTIVVGAISHPNGGAAYVYARDTALGAEWVPHAQLVPTDDMDDVSPSGNSGLLGSALATDGVTVLVADRNDDGPLGIEDAGSVYLFARDPLGPANQPPAADSGPAQSGTEDVPVTFDASASSDPDGDTLSYLWDFGDGQSVQTASATVSHTYLYGGTFDVTLTVDDGRGSQSSDTTTATITEVNDTPAAETGGPYNGNPDEAMTFDGSGSLDFDNQDGTTANDQTLTYTWDFGDGSPAATGVVVSHVYTAEDDFTVALTVSDGVESHTTTTTASVFSQPVATKLHVADLDGFASSLGKNWQADVTITVVDDLRSPVQGADVDVVWSGGYSGTGAGTTDTEGRLTVSSGSIPKKVGSTTLTVVGVAHTTLVYDQSANSDPDGDSSGSEMTVFKDGTTAAPQRTTAASSLALDDIQEPTQPQSLAGRSGSLTGDGDTSQEVLQCKLVEQLYAADEGYWQLEVQVSDMEEDDSDSDEAWGRLIDQTLVELSLL